MASSCRVGGKRRDRTGRRDGTVDSVVGSRCSRRGRNKEGSVAG
jgi:hypothetical protein